MRGISCCTESFSCLTESVPRSSNHRRSKLHHVVELSEGRDDAMHRNDCGMPWPWASLHCRLSASENQLCLGTITSSAVQLRYPDVEACALVTDGCSVFVSATSVEQAGYHLFDLAGQAVALLHMRYLSPAGDLYTFPSPISDIPCLDAAAVI